MKKMPNFHGLLAELMRLSGTHPLSRQCATLLQIIRLPVASLSFDSRLNPENIQFTYDYFTKPHPKYKLFKNKSLGAALIDLRCYPNRDKYMDDIKGKNAGGWHAKRAKSRGYVFSEIERNDFIDEIHQINTCMESRQGRPMDEAYLEKKYHYESISNHKYYGILNGGGGLVAYCNCGFYGNFAAFSQLLGHRSNDGIMHLLTTEIICRLIDEGKLRYVMYDTFFGAQPGLRLFKTALGFKPYRAKYSIQ